MSKTLTISYKLKPPAETVASDAYPTSKAHEFVVPAGTTQTQQEFYKALCDATALAKAQIGADLTVWRDVIGTQENVKESKNGQKEDDEDEEEGEK